MKSDKKVYLAKRTKILSPICRYNMFIESRAGQKIPEIFLDKRTI